MSDDERELRTVIHRVTERVRQDGHVLGAQIGVQLRRHHPQFELAAHGFANLTDMLERAAPELSIVGRRGQDYLWSTDADLDQLDADLEPDDVEPVVPEGRFLLDRFRIRNFKALAKVDVSLRPFNVIVGANGAGKTSILEGLFLLSQLRYKKPATIFSGSRTLGNLVTIGARKPMRLTIEIDSGHAQLLEYEGQPGVDQPDGHRVRIGIGDEISEHDYTHVSVATTLPRHLPLLRAFGGSTLLRLDARKLARPSGSTRERPSLRRDGRGLASVLTDLAATDPDRLGEIFEATREIIPAFESARMPRQRLRGNEGAEIGNGLQLKLYGKWIDASIVSEGTMLVLGLMTIIHGVRSTRLLLMDDIERALHPKAQRTLVERLAMMTKNGAGLQLVCTTHSPYMLDVVDPEDILVVRAATDSGLSRCRRLVEHDAWDKWRQSMTPGEFWTYVGEDWLEHE
ncbi:MAG: AAA family ATPase [Myxococcota bacterium]